MADFGLSRETVNDEYDGAEGRDNMSAGSYAVGRKVLM